MAMCTFGLCLCLCVERLWACFESFFEKVVVWKERRAKFSLVYIDVAAERFTLTPCDLCGDLCVKKAFMYAFGHKRRDGRPDRK